MAKQQPTPTKIPLTMKAVATFKTTNGQGLLSESIEITIEDGIVTSIKRLNRGPDIPASAVGAAQRMLWDHLRSNVYEGQ